MGWTMPDSIIRNLKIYATLFCSYEDLLKGLPRTVWMFCIMNLIYASFLFHFLLLFWCPLPHLSLCVSFPLASIPFICLILPRRQPYLFTLRLYGRYVLLVQQSKISTNATGMIQLSANTEQFSFEKEKKNETLN